MTDLDKLLGGITEDNRHPEFPPVTQPEIPDALREAGLMCWIEALRDGTPDAGNIIAAALLAERNRTIEECAGIADSAVNKLNGDAKAGMARAIARRIRALVK